MKIRLPEGTQSKLRVTHKLGQLLAICTFGGATIQYTVLLSYFLQERPCPSLLISNFISQNNNRIYMYVANIYILVRSYQD